LDLCKILTLLHKFNFCPIQYIAGIGNCLTDVINAVSAILNFEGKFMKLKIKLSIMVGAIVASSLLISTVLATRKASAITMGLSVQSLENLAFGISEYWKGRENGHLRVLRTLADIMEDFEGIPKEDRRDRFDSILRDTITSNPNFMSLYTIWKSDAIDNMDERYIGREGSSPTGQYAVAYSIEDGQIKGRTSTDIDASINYFNSPKSKKDRVEDPFFINRNGKYNYCIRLMAPIIDHKTKETIGGVGCLLDISEIQTVLEQNVLGHKELSIMAIYANNWFVLAHVFPERIGKMMIDTDIFYGENLKEASTAVLNGTSFSCAVKKENDPKLTSDMTVVFQSYAIGNSDKTWTVMIGSPENFIFAGVNKMVRTILIITGVIIVFTLSITYFALSRVTKPIVMVADTLKDISEGEGDLTRNININSNDEIGSLSKYFNQTLEKIKNLVISIKNHALELSDTGNELASNMTETAAAVNEIATNIQSIKERIINQSASVTETNATMEQITVNINKLNGHVESQTSSISQSSSAIEEMLANIQSVTQTLIKNGENANDLTESSKIGHTSLQGVATDIQQIAKESEGLLEINSVMENIASQTNLLSMNAAIEAAHAGESGKGFAVVADEIRNLAENSSKQSKTISTVLKKIKESIDKITTSTDNVLHKFKTIDSGVKVVVDQEMNIRNAMEEQNQGSKQILQAIGQVNDITREVKNSSTIMLEGSNEVIRESKNLEKVTQEITGGMNEMAAGAEQINTAVNQVNDLCNKNQEHISLLVKEVSKFKVE